MFRFAYSVQTLLLSKSPAAWASVANPKQTAIELILLKGLDSDIWSSDENKKVAFFAGKRSKH